MREHMRRIELFSAYDHTGMEAHLEKMARRGWMLEDISGLGWRYRRTRPEELTFSITYDARASEFDPEPSEAQKTYQEFCAHSGWRLAASSGVLQVYYTDRRDAVAIQTDPALEVELLHRTMVRTFLPVYLLLLLVGLWQGGVFCWKLLGDPIALLVKPVSLFLGPMWLMLMAYVLSELAGYLMWRRRALRAAERGEFLPTRGHRWLLLAVIAVALMGAAYWLALESLWSVRLSVLLFVGYLAAMYLGTWAASRGLKALGASRGVNRGVTVALCVLLSGGLVWVMVGELFPAVGRELEEHAQEGHTVSFYEYQGDIQTRYEDTLELTVETCLEVDGEDYSYWLEAASSALLSRSEGRQTPMLWALGEPELEYTLLRVKFHPLYSLCFSQLLHRWDGWIGGTEEEPQQAYTYRPIDPAPWGAKAAYQRYNGPEAQEHYLVGWEDCILELSVSWPLTDEQAGQIQAALH